MDRWHGKTAVVIGITSDFGKAITFALLRNEVNVIALSVREEKIALIEAECEKEDFPGTFSAISCNVRHHNDIESAFSIIEELSGVDIMVNCFCAFAFSQIIESDRPTFETLININVLALVQCMNKAVSSMRKRNVEGYIFHLNCSLNERFPLNTLSDCNLYPATKLASDALTDTVRRELEGLKAPIRITRISLAMEKMYRNVPLWQVMTDCFDTIPTLHSKYIADTIIFALGTPPDVEITQLAIQPGNKID